MRLHLAPAAVLFLLIGCGAIVMACGDDRPPPAEFDSTNDGGVLGVTPTPPGSPATDGGLPDAEDDANTDGAPPVCNTIATDGPLVGETFLDTSTPAATGGAPASGVYWLTERDRYGASSESDSGAPQDDSVHRSMLINGTTVQMAEVGTAGVASRTMSTSTYEVFDTIISLKESCPAKGAANNIRFSIVGSDLWLFPASDRREVYTHQP